MEDFRASGYNNICGNMTGKWSALLEERNRIWRHWQKLYLIMQIISHEVIQKYVVHDDWIVISTIFET